MFTSLPNHSTETNKNMFTEQVKRTKENERNHYHGLLMGVIKKDRC